jgi:cytochrome c peroxidase
MHNGALKSLEDVVRFYSDREAMIAAGDLVPEVPDTRNQGELGQLALSEDAVKAVAAFMRTLSDGYWRP